MARKRDIDKRKIAFQLYRKNNTLNSIADELGTTQPTISAWKKEDGWDEKLLKVQGLLKARLSIKETRENTLMVDDDERSLHLLDDLEDIIYEKIYNEELEPTSWSDVISTLRFTDEKRRLIKGKPTVTTETTYSIEVKGLDNDELDRRIKETQRAITILEPGKDQEGC